MNRMDDPILWGLLPTSYLFKPDNMRWGLGSYDLCFTNKCALVTSCFAQHANDHTGDYRHSLRWGKSYLRIDLHTHNTAAYSNQR